MKRTPCGIIEIATVSLVMLAVAALLSPVLSAARLSKDAVTCQDNERKIASALLRYTDDYNGGFPPARATVSIVWKDSVAPYLGSARSMPVGASGVFRCPTNFAAWEQGGDETGRWPRSYAVNGSLYWMKYKTTNQQILRVTDIVKPSRFLFLMESREVQPDLGVWMVDGIADEWTNTLVKYHNQNNRSSHGNFHHHDKRINMVMVDGHAVAVTLTQTLSDPQMWDPWHAPDAYLVKIDRILPEYR